MTVRPPLKIVLPLIGLALCCRTLTALTAESETTLAGELTPLRASLVVNLDYCNQWLAAKDFKTLEQTAGGLEILGHTLAGKSDDQPWQQATAGFQQTARELQIKARSKDGAAAKNLIKQLRQQAAALPAPTGKPIPSGRAKTGLRTMMALLDGTLADAKTGVAVGDLENAKTSAAVLKELGQALSNYRSGDNWSQWSRQFAEAAARAASHTGDNPKELRAQLKAVHQACQNCHDKR